MNKFGLEDHQLELFLKLVVLPLKKHGSKVWVFGSRARGDQKAFSDLDVLYEHLTDDFSQIVSGIKERIEDSQFPFTVDLVAVQDLANAYAPSVLKDRVEV